MKIEELIERLQEEHKIHPYADIVMGLTPSSYSGTDITEVIFNGQKLILIP